MALINPMAGEPVLPEPPPDDAIPVNNPEPDAGGGGGADVDDEEEGVMDDASHEGLRGPRGRGAAKGCQSGSEC
jgi:hypothetical protein